MYNLSIASIYTYLSFVVFQSSGYESQSVESKNH